MHPALPLTVAIVHAHEVVRMGLRTILEGSGTIKVVLERPDTTGLLGALPPEGVQVMLLNLGTAVQLVLDAATSLRRRHPAIGLLLFGEMTPLLARRGLEAHAGGLLHSAAPAEEWLKCVELVAQGGMYMNGMMREQLLAKRRPAREPAQQVVPSPQQLQVLRCLCMPEYLSRKRIADRLGIGLRTVDTHIENLFRKFKVDSRHELVHQAMDRGLFR